MAIPTEAGWWWWKYPGAQHFITVQVVHVGGPGLYVIERYTVGCDAVMRGLKGEQIGQLPTVEQIGGEWGERIPSNDEIRRLEDLAMLVKEEDESHAHAD